jgi:hypothetical protein
MGSALRQAFSESFSEALAACRCVDQQLLYITTLKIACQQFFQIISKPIPADNFYILSPQPNAVNDFLIFPKIAVFRAARNTWDWHFRKFHYIVETELKFGHSL